MYIILYINYTGDIMVYKPKHYDQWLMVIPWWERSTDMGFHSSLQDRFFPSPIATQSDSLDHCTSVKHRHAELRSY